MLFFLSQRWFGFWQVPLSVINVNLSMFEKELFCIMAGTQYIQAEMFSLIPFLNVPSGERTKHFQRVHSAPSEEEEKRPAPACQQNVELVLGVSLWKSSGRHQRMQNSMFFCATYLSFHIGVKHLSLCIMANMQQSPWGILFSCSVAINTSHCKFVNIMFLFNKKDLTYSIRGVLECNG